MPEKKNGRWLIILPILIIIFVVMWGIVAYFLAPSIYQNQININQAEESKIIYTKIGDILDNPDKYDNKTVNIKGKFGGWNGNSTCDTNKTAMKNKTDSTIYDQTGCLYMTSKVLITGDQDSLRPLDKNALGKDITVKARVSLINDKIILTQTSRTLKTAKLPAYYQNLANICLEKSNQECCIDSVETMASGNFKAADSDNNCSPGFKITGLLCKDGYSWCEPIEATAEICDYFLGETIIRAYCNMLIVSFEYGYADDALKKKIENFVKQYNGTINSRRLDDTNWLVITDNSKNLNELKTLINSEDHVRAFYNFPVEPEE